MLLNMGMTNPNDRFRDPADAPADIPSTSAYEDSGTHDGHDAVARHDSGTAAVAPHDTAAHEPGAPRKAQGSLAGSTWVALIIGAIVLIVLLAFIMQNMQNVTLTLFAWTFSFPLGIGMLLAAIAGALLMAIVGGVRIMQLRRQVRG